MSEENDDVVIERPSQIEVATREALQTLGYSVTEKDDRQWTHFSHPNLLNGSFWMGYGYPRFWIAIPLEKADKVPLAKKIAFTNKTGLGCTCSINSQNKDGEESCWLRITGLIPVDGSVAVSTSQIGTWLALANAYFWSISSVIEELNEAAVNRATAAPDQMKVPSKLVERSSWPPFSKN